MSYDVALFVAGFLITVFYLGKWHGQNVQHKLEKKVCTPAEFARIMSASEYWKARTELAEYKMVMIYKRVQKLQEDGESDKILRSIRAIREYMPPQIFEQLEDTLNKGKEAIDK